MTPEQRKTIEQEFYNYNSNDNALWKTVFDYMLIRYKFKTEEKFLRKIYIEHKPKNKVCKEVGIAKRTYDYWREKLLLDAYMFAKEFNLV